MLLVTGATGIVGRSLLNLLASEDVKVRAVTRDPHRARLPTDVEVVHGDPARPDTIAPHLDGVTAMFLHPRAAGQLVALARQRGVQRVVALSAMNADEPLHTQPSRYRGGRNKEAEDAVAGSGLEWVSLRPAAFATSSLAAWGAQIRAGDVVRGPYAAFTEAPIHELDIAGVAARAHVRPVGRRPRRRLPELTRLPGTDSKGLDNS